MAKQIVNVGQEANDTTGDPIRTAWQKAMSNFNELYEKFDDITLLDLKGIADGDAGQVLTTNGSGTFTFEDAAASYTNASVDTHLNTDTATNNQILSWTGTDYDWITPAAAANPGIQLTDLTVGAEPTAAGNGSLTYNNQTGEFVYTPPVIPAVPADLTDLGITDGEAGQVLTTDGAGAFTFETPAGGGGSLQARAAKAGTTASLNNDATANLDIAGFKGYALLAIQTSAAAWVRIYANGAARTADASRAQTSDPAPDAGIIAEVITAGAQTVLISPGTIGYNFEATPTTNIPCAVTNKSGGAAAITVTLTAIQLEA